MRRFIAIAFVLLIAVAAVAADKVVKRGVDIAPDAKLTPLADVIAKPGDYVKTPVVVEGVVSSACTEMGCWMELKPENAKNAIHITFKDRAFFVPTDAKGMKARVIGVASLDAPAMEHEAEHKEHHAKEGASCSGDHHAAASQVAFVASGVELHRD